MHLWLPMFLNKPWIRLFKVFTLKLKHLCWQKGDKSRIISSVRRSERIRVEKLLYRKLSWHKMLESLFSALQIEPISAPARSQPSFTLTFSHCWTKRTNHRRQKSQNMGKSNCDAEEVINFVMPTKLQLKVTLRQLQVLLHLTNPSGKSADDVPGLNSTAETLGVNN